MGVSVGLEKRGRLALLLVLVLVLLSIPWLLPLVYPLLLWFPDPSSDRDLVGVSVLAPNEFESGKNNEGGFFVGVPRLEMVGVGASCGVTNEETIGFILWRSKMLAHTETLMYCRMQCLDGLAFCSLSARLIAYSISIFFASEPVRSLSILNLHLLIYSTWNNYLAVVVDDLLVWLLAWDKTRGTFVPCSRKESFGVFVWDGLVVFPLPGFLSSIRDDRKAKRE